MEILTVPKHNPFQIAMGKQYFRGYIFFQNLHQHEVCTWLEQTQVLVRAHCRADQVAFGEDTGAGFLNIGSVIQHGSTCGRCQTGNAVRRCSHIDDRHIRLVVHDCVGKPQPRYTEELRYTAQDDQVVVFVHEGDCCTHLVILGKFDIHLV